jgi:DNA polymerase III subunit alpha
MAGYSLEEADNLRKACGKKIRDMMAKEREKFVAGVVRTGYGEELGTRLFDLIEPFADYAFPKAHAYGYGLIAYQTAWCKAHHPVEYLSALLTSVRDDKDRTAVYLAECRAVGIEVAVPDVNRALADFTPAADDPRTIVFGMAAVRNVGESLVERIVAERTSRGPFTSVYDVVRRVDPVVLNKRTMESLIKGGAFDSLGVPRKGLYLVVEDLVARTLERRREHDAGIATLFAAAAEAAGDGEATWEGTELAVPDVEFAKQERLRFEKEMLGLYVSDHPLLGAAGMLSRHTDHTIAEAKELAEGPGQEFAPVVRVGGVVTDVQRRFSKRGEEWARFTLEDLGGAIEVLCFSKPFAEHGAMLESDAVVVVTGRLDTREDAPKLVVMSVAVPRLEQDDDVLRIRLPLGKVTESFVGTLKGVLAEHPGPSAVQLLLVGAEERTIQLPREFSVDVRAVVGVLRTMLGPDAIAA